MMQRIFTVSDTFKVDGKGLILIGVTHDDSLLIADGNAVIVKRPGLPDIETFSLGFELMRNCWSQHKPKNMALLLPAEVGQEEMAEGAEVWSEARASEM